MSQVYELIKFSRLITLVMQGQVLMVHTNTCYPLSPETILRHFKALKEGETLPATLGNCTMIAENLLLHPGNFVVFTVRDPRLAIPSAHRAMSGMGVKNGGGFLNFFSVTCPIWNRLMYDFYVSKGFTPLIIDADDYVTDVDFVRSLCLRLGLNPNELQLSWPPASDEQKKDIHPMYYASQRTLIDSGKPEPSLAGKNIDLTKAMGQWDQEFGDDVAVMKELAQLAWPHYEYLLQRKWKPSADGTVEL